ncbi:MAG: serine protease [Phycisphaerales bacterium]|nr:MAG: serine protease [Phycisphaerales bacterium]
MKHLGSFISTCAIPGRGRAGESAGAQARGSLAAHDRARSLQVQGLRSRKSWRACAIPVLVVLYSASVARSSPAAASGGLDEVIAATQSRVIKLYGLGAGQQAGYGSGIIVSASGEVLTVESLLIDARSIRAIDAAGKRYEAAAVYRDPSRQLALLQLRRPGQPVDVPAPVTESEDVPATSGLQLPAYFDVPAHIDLIGGQWVLAAGNAFRIADGDEPVTVARGVFSTRTRLDARRRLKDYPYRGDVLVIDCITNNPGMPGGALVDLDGRLVGMIGREVQANQTNTHLNYALPADVLSAFLSEARAAVAAGRHAPAEDRERGDDRPPDLGLRIARTGYRTVLPFVERVIRGTPAARAGLRSDDLILSINGRQISSAEDFDAVVATLRAGDAVDLVIRRDRDIKSIRIEQKEVSE